SALPDASDMTTPPSLSVVVDGEAAPTVIALQAGDFAAPATATREEIRDGINRRTTKLVASLSNDNRLVLTSSGQVAHLGGGFSSLQVTDAVAALGLAANATPVSGTPADRTTTGTTLARLDGLQVGSTVRLSDGTHAMAVKLTRITPAAGAVEWTP